MLQTGGRKRIVVGEEIQKVPQLYMSDCFKVVDGVCTPDSQ